MIKNLKEQFGYSKLVMVGDGATDLHTCPPAVCPFSFVSGISTMNFTPSTSRKAIFCGFQDAFIGFGGNQIRDEVKKNAKWFVTKFSELSDELQSIPT